MTLLNPARMESASRPECLPETRVEILKLITNWLMIPPPVPNNPSPDSGTPRPRSSSTPNAPFPNLTSASSDPNTPSFGPNVLWLSGVAGSGKSTIANTIATRFLNLRRRGAFLHFARNDPVNSNPNAVIRTLSYQLARFHPRIRAAISKQLEENAGLETASIALQFEKLVQKPLEELDSSDFQGPIIIVLDALDECGEASSRASLLDVLRDGLVRFPVAFRILITSRDELDIRSSLSTPNVVRKTIDTVNADPDIELYFQHSLLELCRKYPSLSDTLNDKKAIPKLVEKAGGLFIWASTAVKFVGERNPETRLESFLSHSAKSPPQAGLDALYKTVLEANAFSGTTDEEARFYKSVLGAIVVARIPMTDVLIDQMLGASEYKAASFLEHVQSIFYWKRGESIRPTHASVLDYLSDPCRCGTSPWFVDVSFHHEAFAKRSFAIMAAELHFNISKFDTSFRKHRYLEEKSSRRDAKEIAQDRDDSDSLEAKAGGGLRLATENGISAVLGYVTRHWGDHICQAMVVRDADGPDKTNKHGAEHLQECMSAFMSGQFLYWLEVLSALKAMPQAASIVGTAAQWIRVSLMKTGIWTQG